MDVLFAVFGNEERGSTRYRVLNIIPYLEEAGMNCDVLSLVEPDDIGGPWPIRKGIFGARLSEFAVRLLTKAPQYDVVYLQKIPPTASYIKLLTMIATNVVYDFDDALYTSKPWEDSDETKWKDNLDATLGTVSMVVTGSPTLTDYADQFNDETRTMPTPMPRWPYQKKRQEYADKDTGDGVVLGWIGYPENLWYIEPMADAIADVLDEYDDAELHIITAGDLPVAPLADRDDVRYREWSLDKQIDYPAQADIGIRPLSDDPWTRSKNFASVNQFMALGKPVVVTPVGMLNENVAHGRSGFYATTEDEWREYLGQLIEEPDLREEMGNRALQAVEENNFWLDQRGRDMIEALEDVVET